MGVEGRVSLQPDTKARSPNVKQLDCGNKCGTVNSTSEIVKLIFFFFFLVRSC